MMVATASAPLRTTARSSAAPTARMVACGGLITAAKSLMPYMPRLEIAVEPPWYSCGFRWRVRAGGVVLHRVGNRRERLALGLAHDRRDQPARDRHRDADVGMLVVQHAGFGPG